MLVYVDDATGRLMHLRFCQSESAFDYMMATHDYLDKHGKPVAFYSDNARYRESGPLALANCRHGLRGNRQLVPSLAEVALGIIRDKYADFGPTLAREKLAELHDVVLAKETVRQLMVRAGLWIPRKMRALRILQPRYRRACVGGLIH